MVNNLIFNFIEKNIHLVTVNVDKFCRKVKTGGANLEVTTVPYLSLSANFKLQHETYLVRDDWQFH